MYHVDSFYNLKSIFFFGLSALLFGKAVYFIELKVNFKIKFPLGKMIAHFILREQSKKKRLEITVCDEIMEQGFHGCTQKTIISLEISVRSVPIFRAELENMHALVKERTTTLEQTQARLEMCLNNEKSQVVQEMKFGSVELTQDEGELIVADLARTKCEKTKLLREDTDVTARLELEKRKGQKDKDVLWKLFNAALKELEAKTKVIGELKMDPTVSTIPVLWLGSQKREMLEYDSNHKQSKKESKPLIGSIKQENYELNEENQSLNIELRQSIAEMTHDVEEDAPSRPLTVRGVFTHLS